MNEWRPYVVLSVAMSVDGCIDDASDTRLVLSDAADLGRVDEVRAGCDAILVGANTVRKDDPRLLVRSEPRRAARVARGLPPSPTRVTLTGSGALDPSGRIFAGAAATLVYCTAAAATPVRSRLRGLAEVIDAGNRLDPPFVLRDLAGRGVQRLLVEGGSGVQRAFLAADLVDELQLAVAPLLVGNPAAPRFVGGGTRAFHLAEARPVGGLVLLRYLFG